MNKDVIESIVPKLSFKFPYSTQEWRDNLYIENYHCHKDFSNTALADSPTTIAAYAKRIKELGTKCLYSGEHGNQGNQFEVYECAEQNGLKYVHSTEAYWVKDRHLEDSTNCHIYIAAASAEGREDLNYILSIANEDGFYYRPRIDLELLFSVNPKNFIVTSACFTKGNQVLTNLGYKNIEEIQVGDRVKNRYGEWEKVNYPTKIHYQGKGFIFETNDYLNNKTTCTEDHKFLVTSASDLYNNKDFKWMSIKDIYEIYFLSNHSQAILLKPITVDYSCNDIIFKHQWENSYFKGERHNWSKKYYLPNEIRITPELMRMLGFFIGDGCITLKKNKRICFTVNSNEFDYYYNDFFSKVEEQLCIKFSYVKRLKSHRVDVSSSSTDLIDLFYWLFGECKADNKHIPERLIHISKELDSELLLGMLLSDGNFRNTEKEGYVSGRITYSTISEILAKQFMHLCESLKIKSTYGSKGEYVDKNGVHHKKSYRIESSSNGWKDFTKTRSISTNEFVNIIDNLYGASNIKPFIERDGITYKKILIKSFEEITLNEDVYCLNNNTHSFISNGVIAHNCVAGWKYEDAEEIWLKIANYFGDNFFLEVQSHDTDSQKKLNARIIKFAQKNNLQIICGLDSHYIYPEDDIKREIILEYKKVHYEDEDGWYLDYPDGKTVYDRFVKQNVLTDEQILAAMMNTNVFVVKCQEIILDKKFKLPCVYPDTTYEERVEIFKKLLAEKYKDEKLKSVEKKDGIKYETEQIVDSGVVDYFLTNYKGLKEAVENEGGVLTTTSRGSMASFVVNKLLGFTTVDRFNSEVPIYPERFLTKERVLSGQLPDCDFNVAAQEPFVKAFRKILGYHSVYPLMAVEKIKEKNAWQMYSKVNGVSPETANEVSKYIDAYNKDVSNAEDDEKDSFNIEDYIPKEYILLYEKSKEWQGITINLKVHACAFLLLEGDIRRKIGLISAISKTTGKRTLVACVEGKYLDSFGYCKNDFLIVDSVSLTKECFESIGRKVPSFDELREMIKEDIDTWDIYKKGITCCVNQVEKEETTKKVMAYKPQNLGELSSFIAAIRPGFKSLIWNFIERKPYTTGETKIDDILSDSYHYMIYQESIMKVLAYLGLDMKESYGVIKNISKKKLKGEKLQNLKDELTEGWEEKIGDFDNFEKIWQVINDAAKYSFNSPHSLSMGGDSAYLAWFKAHYTVKFYEVAINHYQKKGNKDKIDALIHEINKFYGYRLGEFRFGQDNRQVNIDEKERIIYPNLTAVKNISQDAPIILYENRNKEFKNRAELYQWLMKSKLNKTTLDILFKIGYFNKYGNPQRLIEEYAIYKENIDKTVLTKSKIPEELLPEIIKCCGKETNKQLRDIDNSKLIVTYIKNAHIIPVSSSQQARWQIELLGYTTITDIKASIYDYIVINIKETKYGTVYAKIYNLHYGVEREYRCNKKYWGRLPLAVGDAIRVVLEEKDKMQKNEAGNWVRTGEKITEIKCWKMLDNGTLV